jgi:hypothetical protein
VTTELSIRVLPRNARVVRGQLSKMSLPIEGINELIVSLDRGVIDSSRVEDIRTLSKILLSKLNAYNKEIELKLNAMFNIKNLDYEKQKR